MKKSFKFKLAVYFGAMVLGVSIILGIVLTSLSGVKMDEMRTTTSEKLTHQTRDTITNYLDIYGQAIDLLSIDSNVIGAPVRTTAIPFMFRSFRNFVSTYDGADFVYIGYEDTSSFDTDMSPHVEAFYTKEQLAKEGPVEQDEDDTVVRTFEEQATLNAEKGFFAYPHFFGINYDPRARPWYAQALTSDEVIWTPSYIDAFTELPVITVAKQIKDQNNKTIGVIGADISLSTIAETYKTFKIGNTGALFILDHEGNVISHPDLEQFGTSVIEKSFWDDMTKGDSGTIQYELDGVKKELYFTTEPITGWKIAVTFKDNELAKDINPIIITNIIILLVCVVIGIGIAFFIATRITGDINKINSVLTQVADGDLTEKVKMNRVDEIGQMGQNLNKTIDTLNEIVNEINVTSMDVKNNTDNLTQAITESTMATEEIAQSIQDVAKGTNTQAMEVQDGSEKMAHVSEKINNVNELSVKMGELSDEVKGDSKLGLVTMKELMVKAEEKQASSEQLSTIITSVDDQSRKISEITSTISSIADQTNLLALNASIESARAGEAGRGFAVVADEIRKLAEQSSIASKDIKDLIDNMLKQSSMAVDTVEKNRKIDSEEFDAVKTTEQTFNRIFEHLDILLSNITEIKVQNKDVTEDSNILLDVMATISSITEETSAASEEVSASTEEQLASMEEISSQTEHLREAVENLHILITKFKTI